MNVEWRLAPWSDNGQNSYIVKLDSDKINAGRGTFGTYLTFEFEITPVNKTQLREEDLWLLSGMVGSNEDTYYSSLMIPAQVVGPNRSHVVVPISDLQIEALEELRNGGSIELRIHVSAVGTVIGEENRMENRGSFNTKKTAALYESNSWKYVKIERERWLELYERFGKGKKKLIEIPMPFLPDKSKQWEEANEAYERVIYAEKIGEYGYAVQEGRKVVECIKKTLLLHWSLPEKFRMSDQLDSIRDQLIKLWGPEQTEKIKMLISLLGAAWEYTSLPHHYGRTSDPLRSDAKFIIELLAALLMYFGSMVEQQTRNIKT